MSLKDLETQWALSPVRAPLRHPLEGLKLEDIAGTNKKELEVNTWYEDLSVTKDSPPDQRLFCRFMHSFLYGRDKVGSKARELPPSLAFSNIKNLEKIRFNFIAVVYHNRPTNPFWDKRPAPPPVEQDPKAKLRVLWTREEEVVPYLSLEINRNQWNRVAAFLKGKPYYMYTKFRDSICSSVYKIFPNVHSNFAGLDQAGTKKLKQ